MDFEQLDGKKDVKCSSLIIFNALTLKYFTYIQLNKIYLSIKFNFYLPLQKHICDFYILAFYFFNLTKLISSTGSFVSFFVCHSPPPPCFIRAFSTVLNEMMRVVFPVMSLILAFTVLLQSIMFSLNTLYQIQAVLFFFLIC